MVQVSRRSVEVMQRVRNRVIAGMVSRFFITGGKYGFMGKRCQNRDRFAMGIESMKRDSSVNLLS